MADDRVIQIAVSPGTQEFPDEVYLLYQSGAVFRKRCCQAAALSAADT